MIKYLDPVKDRFYRTYIKKNHNDLEVSLFNNALHNVTEKSSCPVTDSTIDRLVSYNCIALLARAHQKYVERPELLIPLVMYHRTFKGTDESIADDFLVKIPGVLFEDVVMSNKSVFLKIPAFDPDNFSWTKGRSPFKLDYYFFERNKLIACDIKTTENTDTHFVCDQNLNRLYNNHLNHYKYHNVDMLQIRQYLSTNLTPPEIMKEIKDTIMDTISHYRYQAANKLPIPLENKPLNDLLKKMSYRFEFCCIKEKEIV
jgi:hypothetical protein